jgi:hypothetical protein
MKIQKFNLFKNKQITFLSFQKKVIRSVPEEIKYRHNAGKYNYGKYYVIGADYFSVLNTENGEYFYHQLCKN